MTISPSRIGRRWREYILDAFSGAPDGAPAWVLALAEGDDEGYFGPGSAVWAVHGGVPVIIAGFRALMMQALHPGAMAGVHDWSRYKEDPLGRLSGTVRWVLTTSFASKEGARAGSEFVKKLHERVRGNYGDGVAYSASDPELLRWVHIVFEDAFLACHKAWGSPIPGGADQYVAEWAAAGELMDVANPPRSEAELRAQLSGFDAQLVSDERVAETVRFLRKPPLTGAMAFGYRILFAGAVTTLEPKYRRMLDLRRPWWPAKTIARVALFVLAHLLGRPSTSEKNALMRIQRLSN